MYGNTLILKGLKSLKKIIPGLRNYLRKSVWFIGYGSLPVRLVATDIFLPNYTDWQIKDAPVIYAIQTILLPMLFSTAVTSLLLFFRLIIVSVRYLSY